MNLQKNTSFDAIIIGGGPAGATAGALLAQNGWSVAIIEKTEFPRSKVCGEFISSTSFEVLERIGIGHLWRAQAGPPVRSLALFSREKSVHIPIKCEPEDGLGRALGRDILDKMILSVAENSSARIFQPCRAVEISHQDEAKTVKITTQGGEFAIQAPVVISAHGSWEQGPLPTQLKKVNGSTSFFGFKAYFRGAKFDSNLMSLLAFPGGYGGMVWADGDRLSLSCCIRQDVLVRIRCAYGNVSAADAIHQHLVQSCAGVRKAVGQATLVDKWLVAGPIRPGIRPRYQDDIYRAGNAAGEAHPIIAEGISMAIQSGWLLASELCQADFRTRNGRELAGRNYAVVWRKQFSTRIHAAGLFAQIATFPQSRRTATTIIKYFPSLLQIGVNLAGKVKHLPVT